MVKETEIKKFIAENFPSGKKVHITCCPNDCGEFTIGNKTCECGACRVEMVVETMFTNDEKGFEIRFSTF